MSIKPEEITSFEHVQEAIRNGFFLLLGLCRQSTSPLLQQQLLFYYDVFQVMVIMNLVGNNHVAVVIEARCADLGPFIPNLLHQFSYLKKLIIGVNIGECN